jgi:hypothetical protein
MKTTSAKAPSDNQALSPVEPGFPSIRYFQIHFEHLHDTIDELKKQINQANRQIAELQQQLQGRSETANIGSMGYVGECKVSPSDRLNRDY